MSEMGDLFRVALKQSAALDQMVTLGIEYQAKTITAERFAERIYQLLLDFQDDKKDNHAS